MTGGESVYVDAPFGWLAANMPVDLIFLSSSENGQADIPAGMLKSGTIIRGTITNEAGGAPLAVPAPVPDPPRIHVADLDPDTLVGIALCDDGPEGWVVMGVQPDPDEPGKEIVAPIGDEHGQIVYLDINDAAEVLKTGKVWKHDMGDGVADPKPTTPTE